ncbi:MAG: homoserine dehydrogenase [Eubacteriales bacterium]
MSNIAILGLGVVGGGTADLLTQNSRQIAEQAGEEVVIKYILDKRQFPDSPYKDKVINDYDVILKDPSVAVVAELMGGAHPAYEFSLQALQAGKHVVTSNKEVVSKFGDELLAAAKEAGVSYRFEASTGGGIPILSTLTRDLAVNEIEEISGILNGTTNYILTRMYSDGASYTDALEEAKQSGYAEANPIDDIGGLDVCRKIAILAATTTGKLVTCDRIHTEGITAIRATDVDTAHKSGYTVKLLGRYLREKQECFMVVAPFLVPLDSPLANVAGVKNAILVRGNFVGDVMFYGNGAGAYATASSVVADIVAALWGSPSGKVWKKNSEDMPTDFNLFACRHYLSFIGCDEYNFRIVFGQVEFLQSNDGECTFLTPVLTEREVADGLARLAKVSGGASLASHLRVYEHQ